MFEILKNDDVNSIENVKDIYIKEIKIFKKC